MLRVNRDMSKVRNLMPFSFALRRAEITVGMKVDQETRLLAVGEIIEIWPALQTKSVVSKIKNMERLSFQV